MVGVVSYFDFWDYKLFFEWYYGEEFDFGEYVEVF